MYAMNLVYKMTNKRPEDRPYCDEIMASEDFKIWKKIY
jgi:hypothetical protein